jgi:GMP-PDE, delta subunit
MIESPFETKSDSFYFVNGSLIMHNKASYKVSHLDNNTVYMLLLCYFCVIAAPASMTSHRIVSRDLQD